MRNPIDTFFHPSSNKDVNLHIIEFLTPEEKCRCFQTKKALTPLIHDEAMLYFSNRLIYFCIQLGEMNSSFHSANHMAANLLAQNLRTLLYLLTYIEIVSVELDSYTQKSIKRDVKLFNSSIVTQYWRLWKLCEMCLQTPIIVMVRND
eukprot:UN00046